MKIRMSVFLAFIGVLVLVSIVDEETRTKRPEQRRTMSAAEEARLREETRLLNKEIMQPELLKAIKEMQRVGILLKTERTTRGTASMWVDRLFYAATFEQKKGFAERSWNTGGWRTRTAIG